MSRATPTNLCSHATAADWPAWEAVLKRFEDAWRGPTRPDPFAFLPDPPPARLAAEIAHVDLEFRLRAGEPARVEDYVRRLPVLAGSELLLDLIQAEYALRARSSDPGRPETTNSGFGPRDQGPRVAGRPQTPTRVQNTSQVFHVGVPIIRGYDVLGELGRGGMGSSTALATALDRVVAIKTLAWHLGRCGRAVPPRGRGHRPTRHPHIVPVYEVGTWGSGIRTSR